MKKKLRTCIAVIVIVGIVCNIISIICCAFLIKLFIDYYLVLIEKISIIFMWTSICNIISSVILIIFFILLWLFFHHIKCINSCFINYFSSCKVLAIGIIFQILIFALSGSYFTENVRHEYRYFNSSFNTSETYDIKEKIERQLNCQFQNETNKNSCDYLFEEFIHQKIKMICIPLMIVVIYNAFSLFLFYYLSKKYSDETSSSISEPYSNLMNYTPDLTGYDVPKINGRNIINEPLYGIDFNG